MKNIKRLILGVLSSLLLSIGFVQAADNLDPLSQSQKQVPTKNAENPAPDCTTPTDLFDRNA